MYSQCSYPARIERDQEGHYQVRFPDLPDALTDGNDLAEAFSEAADCLSAALASRILDGEAIPDPSPPAPDQHLVSPDPTIALKAALYEALREHNMTVADLAELLEMDWHQAARLIDPKRSSKLTSLATALGALGYRIAIAVEPDPAKPTPALSPARESALVKVNAELSAQVMKVELSAQMSLGEATLKAVQAHREGTSATEILGYLSREFGMTVRPNHLGIALQRHCRAGQLEKRDERWYPSPSAKVDIDTRSGSGRVRRR